ncbi:TRAP transporter substrate-binding protein [Marinobacterium aestuariivivens]|uniref:TRAP transporter substrate-binding protein n=1 Tax=Marinobacterium aestuariivivens TaxID=1698799 RepID=A0ABW2A2A0_9GAMM
MLKLRSVAILLASLLCISNAAQSQTVMHFATWMPPGHPINAVVLPTWTKWIEEATDNRVTVEVEYDLGDPKSMFDLVEDGVADASWGFHGYVPGRFRLTQIVEQPLLGANAEAASVAHWRVHQKYFADTDEFDGLVLTALVTHGPGQIHSKEALSALADLSGKKIRVGGGVQSLIASRVGISSVGAPAPKVYEMLQQGVIDGVFLPLSEQKTLRLNEVAPNLTVLPGGMYLGSFSFFMNPDFLDSLSDEDRAAILSVSGERLSALGGRAQDDFDRAGLELARSSGVNIHEVAAGDPMAAEFRELVKGFDEQWIESVSDYNVEARAALQELRDIAQRYQPQP